MGDIVFILILWGTIIFAIPILIFYKCFQKRNLKLAIILSAIYWILLYIDFIWAGHSISVCSLVGLMIFGIPILAFFKYYKKRIPLIIAIIITFVYWVLIGAGLLWVRYIFKNLM